MPKLSYRCSRRSHPLPSVAPVAFCAPPRKVSFEDGLLSDDSETSHRSCNSLVQNGERSSLVSLDQSGPMTPPSPKRTSTLRRPKSSLSLVDLVKGGEYDEDEYDNKYISHRKVDDADDETMDILVSPKSKPLIELDGSSSQPQSPLTSSPSPSSPWGHFVDMLIPPLEGGSATNARESLPSLQESLHPVHRRHHEGKCSSSACQRRRSRPYGDYKEDKKQRRGESSAESPSLCFQARRPIPLPSSFKLAPRRRQQDPAADQLICALDRLQVD